MEESGELKSCGDSHLERFAAEIKHLIGHAQPSIKGEVPATCWSTNNQDVDIALSVLRAVSRRCCGYCGQVAFFILHPYGQPNIIFEWWDMTYMQYCNNSFEDATVSSTVVLWCWLLQQLSSTSFTAPFLEIQKLRIHIQKVSDALYICTRVYMYVLTISTFSRVWINPGKVANPARGQVIRENESFPLPVRA